MKWNHGKARRAGAPYIFVWVRAQIIMNLHTSRTDDEYMEHREMDSSMQSAREKENFSRKPEVNNCNSTTLGVHIETSIRYL